MMTTIVPLDNHLDLVVQHHRFPERSYAEEIWEFEHLEPFAIRVPIELTSGQPVDIEVVVLFSNHCFTREPAAGESVDPSNVVLDGSIVRVLDKERYELSRIYLPRLILDLPNRHIQVASHSRPNFVTFEIPPSSPTEQGRRYGVFFEVSRDSTRKRRLLLRVQSAYVLENPSKRLLKAEKMRFHVLLKRAYT